MLVSFNPNISYRNNRIQCGKQSPAFGQADAKLLKRMLDNPVGFYNGSGIDVIKSEIRRGKSKISLQDLKDTVLEFLNHEKIKKDPVCWQDYYEEYQDLCS